MFDKYIEKVIRDHCKKCDYLADLKAIKLLRMKYRETVDCYEGITLVKYDVLCSCKKIQEGQNRAKFQVNIYDNPDGTKINTVGIYFDGMMYGFEVK